MYVNVLYMYHQFINLCMYFSDVSESSSDDDLIHKLSSDLEVNRHMLVMFLDIEYNKGKMARYIEMPCLSNIPHPLLLY